MRFIFEDLKVKNYQKFTLKQNIFEDKQAVNKQD